ncbi:restriction endonuclease [Aequorivita marina]|uniref:restriction endonuclease n=1 Tax=Aequorivita marina TaxID=3073654 RepID=UPI0028747F9C|nr:restriction endonuclease [Aequorivita sp. S2608]MDS1298667.1 restriction endonuclease [Aequorivita sp. S2608]
MGNKSITIKKFNGDLEEFDIEKLKTSLRRSNASESEIKEVTKNIIPTLYDGIPSKVIYKKAFSILKKRNRTTASKYSLKRAILDLGPTGFPFERLIGSLLSHYGYKTQVSVILEGECVSHEVDVLAEKDGKTYAVECKFHTDFRNTSSVKVPLYINSRFLDIQRKWNSDASKNSHLKQGWLITNTRFTTDAIKYGECVGLHLMGWDYPEENGLKQNVDKYALYPITTLTTLKKHEKNKIIENQVILTKDLYESSHLLDEIGLSTLRKNRVLDEIKSLCNL